MCSVLWKSLGVELCLRVRDYNFISRNAFDDLEISSECSSRLGLNADERLYLDVFLSNADDYHRFFCIKNDKCCYFQYFSYTQEIFAAFS